MGRHHLWIAFSLYRFRFYPAGNPNFFQYVRIMDAARCEFIYLYEQYGVKTLNTSMMTENRHIFVLHAFISLLISIIGIALNFVLSCHVHGSKLTHHDKMSPLIPPLLSVALCTLAALHLITRFISQ